MVISLARESDQPPGAALEPAARSWISPRGGWAFAVLVVALVVGAVAFQTMRASQPSQAGYVIGQGIIANYPGVLASSVQCRQVGAMKMAAATQATYRCTWRTTSFARPQAGCFSYTGVAVMLVSSRQAQRQAGCAP